MLRLAKDFYTSKTTHIAFWGILGLVANNYHPVVDQKTFLGSLILAAIAFLRDCVAKHNAETEITNSDEKV